MGQILLLTPKWVRSFRGRRKLIREGLIRHPCLKHLKKSEPSSKFKSCYCYVFLSITHPDELLLLMAGSIAIEVSEAWMPNQAYTEVFMAASIAVEPSRSRPN